METDPPEAGPAPDPTGCPKCGHEQAAPDACHRCGLDLQRFARGEVTLSVPSSLPSSLPSIDTHPQGAALRARWEALADRLEDEAEHRAFIALCSQLGLLAFAGRCYRDLTPAGAEEDPRVTRFREAVLGAAIAQVPQVKPFADRARMRTLIVFTFGAVLLLAIMVGYYLVTTYTTLRMANQ